MLGGMCRQRRFAARKPVSWAPISGEEEKKKLKVRGKLKRRCTRPTRLQQQQVWKRQSAQSTPSLKKKKNRKLSGGDVAQLVERRTGTPLRQVRFPGAARDFFFLPRFNFQSRLFYGVCTPLCAIACINNIYKHVKYPAAHVRV